VDRVTVKRKKKAKQVLEPYNVTSMGNGFLKLVDELAQLIKRLERCDMMALRSKISYLRGDIDPFDKELAEISGEAITGSIQKRRRLAKDELLPLAQYHILEAMRHLDSCLVREKPLTEDRTLRHRIALIADMLVYLNCRDSNPYALRNSRLQLPPTMLKRQETLKRRAFHDSMRGPIRRALRKP
jgi:hypothetical protein